jgi:hypothetical protein
MTKSLRCIGYFLPLLALIACGETNEDDRPTLEGTPFVSETVVVDESYPAIDPVATDIMEKLQICTLTDTVLDLPPCSSELFRVFQYRPDKEWKDGFIVEMIPGVFGSPVHQIVIVENYFGKYRIVNKYLGYLIEMRTKKEGYNDLLIGYVDPDIGVVAIRHEWQGQKYDVVDVEEINDHYVKPELKDSINAVFLPAFAAGY